VKLHFPATQRNRDPILEVLRRVLPTPCTLLELASGSGEHATHFVQHLSQLTIQPTDIEQKHLASIDAWTTELGLTAKIKPAIHLDASDARWPIFDDGIDAVLCCNMIHIAPWGACLGVFRGAVDVLAVGAPLIFYGPFRRRDVVTAPSNEAFDLDLQRRDPSWGVRHLDDVEAVAVAAGFVLDEVIEMPANNLTVVFRRRPSSFVESP